MKDGTDAIKRVSKAWYHLKDHHKFKLVQMWFCPDP